MRRDAVLARKLPLLIVDEAEPMPDDDDDDSMPAPDAIPDERLRLIFTACHPALAPAAQIALTLRYAAGLATAEIARLFHTSEPAMAARLTRAKQKIAVAGIPYRVPDAADLPERLPAVLDVLYLIFTEGHAPTRGDRVVRTDLCAEAIRLAAVLDDLLPIEDEELAGLRALMLLTHARAPARTDPAGRIVTLPEQDRALWDGELIEHGLRLLERAGDGRFGLEARIAAAHAGPSSDWPAIASLYARLEERHPTPAVRLNRAVAVAEAHGPQPALALLDGLDDRLDRSHQLHLVRAELLARAGATSDAADAFARAEELAANAAVRQHVAQRRAEVSGRRTG